MTVVSSAHGISVTAPSRADRALRLSGAVIAAYLAITVWPAIQNAGAARNPWTLLAHLVALEIALGVTAAFGRAPRRLRDWLPLLLGPFLYIDLRWLIAGVGCPHADALVQRWEHAVFPTNPSATWATQLPWAALSEVLHLAYASYYFLVLVPPIVLYARGKRDAYAATVLALTVVYALCFTTYLVFPVDGPRFLAGPAPAPEGPIRSFVLHLLAAGSSRGTAFPSSHVAASVVAALAALRHQRALGVVVALCTVGLTLGTVYGGFHYAVDALAGLVVGALAWFAANALWRALSTPAAQSATDA